MSRISAPILLLVLAPALLSPSACDREEAQGEEPSTSVQEPSRSPRLEFDQSSPHALVESFLSACRETRRAQSESALRSWNAVVDFVRATPWRKTAVNSGNPGRIEDGSELAALEWRIVGEKGSAERREVLVELSCLNQPPNLHLSRECSALRRALRTPLWYVRRFLTGRPHNPVQPSVAQYRRGDLVKRTFWLPIPVQRDGALWVLDTNKYVSGLMLDAREMW